jgi:hypothetical protein
VVGVCSRIPNVIVKVQIRYDEFTIVNVSIGKKLSILEQHTVNGYKRLVLDGAPGTVDVRVGEDAGANRREAKERKYFHRVL